MVEKTATRFTFLGQPGPKGADWVPPGGLEGIDNGTEQSSRTAGSNERSADSGTIDPAQISGKRKPGRPRLTVAERSARAAERSARAPEAKEEVAVDSSPSEIPPTWVDQVALALLVIHDGLLTSDEAQRLSKALCDVAKYYIKLTASNKTTAWIALMLTAGMIYLPKALAKQANKQKPQAESDNVPDLSAFSPPP